MTGTLDTMQRALKMLYGAPTLKAERYLAAEALRNAVHRVLIYDRMIERPDSPQQRAAAIRWRPRAMRRRRAARAKYRTVRMKWNRATPTERERGGLADWIPRRSAFADLMFTPQKGNEWHVQR